MTDEIRLATARVGDLDAVMRVMDALKSAQIERVGLLLKQTQGAQ